MKFGEVVYLNINNAETNSAKIKIEMHDIPLAFYKIANEILPENKILPFFEQYELKSSFDLPNFDPELKHFFARDGHHPGVYSNKVFSDKVIKKIENIQ